MENIEKSKAELSNIEYKIGHCLTYRENGFYEILGSGTDEHGFYIEIESRFYSDKKEKVRQSDLKQYYSYLDVKYSEMLEKYEKFLAGDLDFTKDETNFDSNTQVMSFDKNAYISMRDELERKASVLNALTNRMHNEMENKRRRMNEMVDVFRKKVAKLEKIIQTIELYLGIREEIVQIQSGENHADESPIYFMQNMLFIDEEMGDPTDGGYSIENFSDFDKWLVKKNEYLGYYNHEILIPYKKGVRILRMRRNEKERGIGSDNPFLRAAYIEADMRTYLLIKNGDNIYKICTTINFGSKLFPNQTELIDLYEKELQELKNILSRNGVKITDENRNQEASKAVDKVAEIYKRNFIIMQGLIDRTELFGNIAGFVNLMDISASKTGAIELIYENKSNKIEDGTISPLQFYYNAKKVNEGDQVLFLGADNAWRGDYKKYYFYNIYRNSEYAWPPSPSAGIYTVYKDKGEYKEGVLYIKTPMTDNSYRYYDDEPKRKMTVRFKINDNGCLCVNLNIISHRDLNDLTRLMHDRRGRENYLKTMSTLIEVKKAKEKELEIEAPFAQMIQGQTGLELSDVLDQIHWWKTKNKWKRPLLSDDIKAFRMILKNIKNLQKNISK